MPKVTLIVVNYNARDLIINCLRALEKQLFKHFEVVIIDNGSSDDSLGQIEGFFERNQLAHSIKLIAFKKNLGFAGSNLEELKHSNAEYIALLNSDTEPRKEWLGELVKAMDNDLNVGICASKLIVNVTDIIDSAGDGFPTALRGFKRGEGGKTSSYNRNEFIFGACAGAALYRRKRVDEIGFLDEDFFLIHEDTDLNFRAQLVPTTPQICLICSGRVHRLVKILK